MCEPSFLINFFNWFARLPRLQLLGLFPMRLHLNQANQHAYWTYLSAPQRSFLAKRVLFRQICLPSPHQSHPSHRFYQVRQCPTNPRLGPHFPSLENGHDSDELQPPTHFLRFRSRQFLAHLSNPVSFDSSRLPTCLQLAISTDHSSALPLEVESATSVPRSASAPILVRRNWFHGHGLEQQTRFSTSFVGSSRSIFWIFGFPLRSWGDPFQA